MPVYLRSVNDIPTPTISDFGENDHEDFLQDPDQRWDELPQPFRFLNKILNNVFERAWEIANSREADRLDDASKIRPPQYECALQVKGFENATSICSTPDGKYMVLGLPSGMAAVDALTQETIDIWQHDGVEITSMTSCTFDNDIYLICAVDDMGHGRIFSLTNGVLFLMHTLNEDDSATKSHVSKLESSGKGDFIGVCLENPSTKENWVEIHKTPRDTWTKELESAVAKSNKHQQNTEQKAQSPTLQTEENITEISQPAEGGATEKDDTEKGSQEASQVDDKPKRRTSKVGAGNASTPRAYKFTGTSLVLKIKPPAPIQGINWSSPHQLSKTVDNGTVIGTGQNHLVSMQHLENRWSVFKAFHEKHMKDLPDEEKPIIRDPTFHFLTPGRMMPFGLESPQSAEETNSVMIWWTDHNQLQHFNLVKPSKESANTPRILGSAYGKRSRTAFTNKNNQTEEIEHKPDLVWPTSSQIVATAVSKCTSLVAVAVASGIVTIWDKYQGMKRRVVNVNENIVQLEFLDPSVCPQEESSYPPYTTSTNCYVLVRCKDGTLYLIDSGFGCHTSPSDVSTTLDGPDDQYTQMSAIEGIPELMMSCRTNGRIYIHNIVTTDVLCEIVLPSQYEVLNPWQPIVAAGGHGQMLYIRGKLKPSYETVGLPSPEGESPEQDGLFVFDMRSFPALDAFRTRQRPSIPYTVHNTVEVRVDALFKDRIAQQAARKVRMQERWEHLKEELQVIKELRSKPSQQKIRTNLFATGQH